MKLMAIWAVSQVSSRFPEGCRVITCQYLISLIRCFASTLTPLRASGRRGDIAFPRLAMSLFENGQHTLPSGIRADVSLADSWVTCDEI